jgi:hypothetical protein
MSPLEFAGEVILVSASGVLSPGLLFFIDIIPEHREKVDMKIRLVASKADSRQM